MAAKETDQATPYQFPLLTPRATYFMNDVVDSVFENLNEELDRLGISKNPIKWTPSDVRTWLKWVAEEFSLDCFSAETFNFNGDELYRKGKDEFSLLFPEFVGEILWEHFEMLIKRSPNESDMLPDSTTEPTKWSIPEVLDHTENIRIYSNSRQKNFFHRNNHNYNSNRVDVNEDVTNIVSVSYTKRDGYYNSNNVNYNFSSSVNYNETITDSNLCKNNIGNNELKLSNNAKLNRNNGIARNDSIDSTTSQQSSSSSSSSTSSPFSPSSCMYTNGNNNNDIIAVKNGITHLYNDDAMFKYIQTNSSRDERFYTEPYFQDDNGHINNTSNNTYEELAREYRKICHDAQNLGYKYSDFVEPNFCCRYGYHGVCSNGCLGTYSNEFDNSTSSGFINNNNNCFYRNEIETNNNSDGLGDVPDSTNNVNLTVVSPYFGNGPIQLWQFLLDLLLNPGFEHAIAWTGDGWEFKLVNPDTVAELWGRQKCKPKMNYEKLSRGLRYYYDKKIIVKTPGKRYVYRFVCDMKQLVMCDTPAELFYKYQTQGFVFNRDFLFNENRF